MGAESHTAALERISFHWLDIQFKPETYATYLPARSFSRILGLVVVEGSNVISADQTLRHAGLIKSIPFMALPIDKRKRVFSHAALNDFVVQRRIASLRIELIRVTGPSASSLTDSPTPNR